MNHFELWDKVARNSQYRFPQPFRLVVAVWMNHTIQSSVTALHLHTIHKQLHSRKKKLFVTHVTAVTMTTLGTKVLCHLIYDD